MFKLTTQQKSKQKFQDGSVIFDTDLNLLQISVDGKLRTLEDSSNNSIVGLLPGTAENPSLYFDDDEHLGLYRVSENVMGFTASGAKK